MNESFIFMFIGGGMILFFLLLFVGAIVLHRRKMARREEGFRGLAREYGLTYIGDNDSFLEPFQHLQTFDNDGFASWANELLSGEMKGARVHLFGAAYSTAGGGSAGRFVHYTMCLMEHSELKRFTVSIGNDDQAVDASPEQSKVKRNVQQALSEWNRMHRTRLRADAENGLLLLSVRKRLSPAQCVELLGFARRILDDLP